MRALLELRLALLDGVLRIAGVGRLDMLGALDQADGAALETGGGLVARLREAGLRGLAGLGDAGARGRRLLVDGGDLRRALRRERCTRRGGDRVDLRQRLRARSRGALERLAVGGVEGLLELVVDGLDLLLLLAGDVVDAALGLRLVAEDVLLGVLLHLAGDLFGPAVCGVVRGLLGSVELVAVVRQRHRVAEPRGERGLGGRGGGDLGARAGVDRRNGDDLGGLDGRDLGGRLGLALGELLVGAVVGGVDRRDGGGVGGVDLGLGGGGRAVDAGLGGAVRAGDRGGLAGLGRGDVGERGALGRGDLALQGRLHRADRAGLLDLRGVELGECLLRLGALALDLALDELEDPRALALVVIGHRLGHVLAPVVDLLELDRRVRIDLLGGVRLVMVVVLGLLVLVGDGVVVLLGRVGGVLEVLGLLLLLPAVLLGLGADLVVLGVVDAALERVQRRVGLLGLLPEVLLERGAGIADGMRGGRRAVDRALELGMDRPGLVAARVGAVGGLALERAGPRRGLRGLGELRAPGLRGSRRGTCGRSRGPRQRGMCRLRCLRPIGSMPVDALGDGVGLPLERVAGAADAGGAAIGPALPALHDVGQLVREQLLPGARLGGVRALGEEDVLADGECLGAHGARGLGGDDVAVDADAGERDAEIVLHLAADGRRQRRAAAGAGQRSLDRRVVRRDLAGVERAAIQGDRAALGGPPQRLAAGAGVRIGERCRGGGAARDLAVGGGEGGAL